VSYQNSELIFLYKNSIMIINYVVLCIVLLILTSRFDQLLLV